MVDDLNRLDFLVPFPEQLTNSVYDVTPHSDEEWTKVSKERMELNICRVDMDSVQDEADWVCASVSSQFFLFFFFLERRNHTMKRMRVPNCLSLETYQNWDTPL